VSRFLAWTALYLAAALCFGIEVGLLGRARAPELAALPARLGALEVVEEIPFDPAALGANPPERHTFLRVRDADGNEGRLFVAWYARAQRWSGRPHDVALCYASLGWREVEAARLGGEQRPWSRLLERDGARIRVVHWLEHPGPDGDPLSPARLAARLTSGRGFRPDVASAYLEFPAETEPDDTTCRTAAEALSAALEELW
jgi:hypothetical protein